ncbi:MAG TPA: DUF222 domain-containing protein, partial [Candidatus Dormibacteraeota bacterium]
ERRGGPREEGATSTTAWLRTRGRVTGGEAATMVCVARHLPELPATDQALRSGEIGFRHTSVIARSAEELGDERVREQEQTLLAAAPHLDVRDFRYLTRYLREVIDPAGALRDANRDREASRVHLSQTLDGVFRLDGILDVELGALLQTALNRHMHPVPGDRRTASQRRAAALADICLRELNAEPLPLVGGQRPHLTVTVPIETLRNEPGSPGGVLRWAGPIVGDLARRLACDCVRTVVTVNAAGDPVSIGPPEQTVTAGVRRKLAARDRRCRWPRCDRPPEWTDAHHMVFRSLGGRSNDDTMLLLCRPHHTLVHEGGWTIAWNDDGTLDVRPPP